MTSSILIIEEPRENRPTLDTIVRDGFATIESSRTGEAALMRLGMTSFDCVLLRSPVPVEFGRESSTMLDLFDRLAPNLASHLVVVTSADATDILRRAVQMQVCAIFVEPFDAAELRGVVKRCMAGDAPQRRLYGASENIERLLEADPAPAT